MELQRGHFAYFKGVDVKKDSSLISENLHLIYMAYDYCGVTTNKYYLRDRPPNAHRDFSENKEIIFEVSKCEYM